MTLECGAQDDTIVKSGYLFFKLESIRSACVFDKASKYVLENVALDTMNSCPNHLSVKMGHRVLYVQCNGAQNKRGNCCFSYK